MTSSQNKPIALLVGASSGLGREIALILAEHYHLVLLASAQARLEETDDLLREKYGVSATLVPMNLEKHDEIDAMIASLWQRFGRLDLLCLLAATIAEATPLAHCDPKGFNKMLNVNFVAHFRILRACDAILRQSENALVASITGTMSTDGKTPNAYTAGFDASKAALLQLMHSYARELEQTSVRAITIDPACFASRLRRKIFPGQKSESLPSAADKAAKIAKILLDHQVINAAHYDV